MEKVVQIVRMEDYCPSCHSKYSIDLFDVYGNNLGLTRLLNRKILEESIQQKKLSHMKCRKCGKEYKIDYTCNDIRPLNEDIDIPYKTFIKELEKRKDDIYGKHILFSRDKD